MDGIAYIITWHIMWLEQPKFSFPTALKYFPSLLFLVCSAADISYTAFHTT